MQEVLFERFNLDRIWEAIYIAGFCPTIKPVSGLELVLIMMLMIHWELACLLT